ncbi:MAG: hypothetical protein ABFC57_06195 [Veillonellales bacterium]
MYSALLKESKKVGYPEAYQTDLTEHDKRNLRGYKGPYLWILRQHGTHLCLLEGRVKQELALSLRTWEYYIAQDTTCRYYYYNGELMRVKPAVALAILRDSYRAAVDGQELARQTLDIMANRLGSYAGVQLLQEYFAAGITYPIAHRLQALSVARTRKFLVEINTRHDFTETGECLQDYKILEV